MKRNKARIENFFEKLFKEYIKAQKETDFYFYDKELEIKLNDALKMILGIILSDLTGTSIFLRGHPGSGKSCAGSFYGSKRSFNFREPIISVSCNSDLSLEALIGTYLYKDSKFEFAKGPLLKAMENGVPILLDEFNLCHESIFSNLLPVFKAKTYEDIDLKYVPIKVKKNPGFFIIATGNFSKEKGRKKIPKFIMDEINLIEVENFSYDKSILDKIINNKNEFISLKKEDNNNENNNYRISVEQLIKIFESIRDITQFNFSIR